METPRHDGFAGPGRVVLAREVAFRLGTATVRPSTRQVENEDQAITIEPRMMQVLVALARAKGEVVTRDELVDRCWEGRVVGDDAVNRVIWRLRQLAERLGPQSFSLKTIARVGFRLEAVQSAGAPSLVDADGGREASHSLTRRASLAAGIALAGLTSLGAMAWSSSGQRHAPDPRAKHFFDQALRFRGHGTGAETDQSVAFLAEATRIDPDYAEAWGALAWAYRSLCDYAPEGDLNQLQLAARSAADRALQLDNSNLDAAAALLLVRPMLGRWTEVEEDCRKILAGAPDHSVTEYGLALVLWETGRLTESIAHLRRVAAREPFWSLVRLQLCEALLSSGRIDEAEDQLEAAWRIWPRRHDLWRARSRFLLASGRKAEALDFVHDELNSPSLVDSLLNRERTLAAAYKPTSLVSRETAVEAILRKAESGEWSLHPIALDAAFIGEGALALELFEGYFLGRGRWRSRASKWPVTLPLFRFETETIRGDPRFAELVRTIGLERHWVSSGRMPDYRLA